MGSNLAPDRHSPSREIAVCLGCVLLSLWAAQLALRSYFSPDDLILLERASGLAPFPGSLWRIISGRIYFEIVHGWFGTNAQSYMLVNVGVHALNVALTYLLARRLDGSIVVAALASVLFGASRLFLSVLGQVVGIGEVLALAFALVACIALTFSGLRPLITSTVAFALALLSKESVALVPLSLVLSPALGDRVVVRLRRVLPLLALSVAWIMYLSATASARASLAGPAYQVAFDGTIPTNLLRYLQWSLDMTTVVPGFTGVAPDTSWGGGVVGALAMAVVLWVARGSRPVAIPGLVWWLLGVTPVLPLVWQHHLHYLYVPCAGLAIAVAAFSDDLVRSAASRVWSKPLARFAPLAFAVLLILPYLTASRAMVATRLSQTLPDIDIPLDPLARKAELIKRVSQRVEQAFDHQRVRIAFYLPDTDTSSTFYSNLLPAILDGGRGLRALHATVDSVVFIREWTPQYAEFEIVAASVDGYVLPFGKGPNAHLALAQTMRANGFTAEAAHHLSSVIESYPSDLRLRFARAGLLAQMGDSAKARQELAAIIAADPNGPLADEARKRLKTLVP